LGDKVMSISKDEIIKAIREGRVKEVIPPRRKPKLTKLLEEIQPATFEEMLAKAGRKEAPFKAWVTRLLRKGVIKAIEYKGRIFYVTTTFYEKLRAEGK